MTGQQVRLEPAAGCWVAHYADWSGFGLFDSELEALRYAVEHNMSVTFQTWGEVRR